MKFPSMPQPKRTLIAMLCCLSGVACSAAEPATVIAAPQVDAAKNQGALQTAIVAGGCFWGVQGVYEHVRGVKKVVSGYAGGEQGTAQYDIVSGGRSGHAESVQITYDPAQVTYGQLLHIFFSVAHDPTQLNHQGYDTGTQYRSAIFYNDETQKKVAQAYIAQLDKSHAFSNTIVTALTPASGFYPAEDYHQDYLTLHPTNPYIVQNDLPKIANLKRIFPEYYREDAVLTSAR